MLFRPIGSYKTLIFFIDIESTDVRCIHGIHQFVDILPLILQLCG